MSENSRGADRPAKISMALAVVAFGLFAGSCFFGDALFRANLNTAIAEYGSGTESQSPVQTVSSEHAIVGNEDFWLGHAKNSPGVNVSWSHGVEIGDEIAIATDNRQRLLEVESVVPISASDATHIRTGPARSLLMVTARETSQPNGMVIRFVIEDSDTLPLPAYGPRGHEQRELSAL